MSELKVTADHLKRDAYLYVRQSTLRQVAENGESTQRQYALRHRAIAAGWPAERVRVIDRDLGKSGSTAAARDGFQELVSEVALAKAGIVMGLEVSRLARNSADWHRLIELCALTATLILDEDGIDDPSNFNDRLLLGLKGTMSEAELHILKARMRGGQLASKSRYLGAQMLAYLGNDLWLQNARIANGLARKLADGLRQSTQVRLAFPVEANEILESVRKRPEVQAALKKAKAAKKE